MEKSPARGGFSLQARIAGDLTPGGALRRGGRETILTCETGNAQLSAQGIGGGEIARHESEIYDRDEVSAGSSVAIFLNGVAAAITGVANDSAVPFTTASGWNGGGLPLTFQVPPIGGIAPTPGVTLTALQAAGLFMRESRVAVCVKPSVSSFREAVKIGRFLMDRGIK